ncbi:DUF4362 domain-containing protein [Mangrovibacillus cuniculi]|uniref:DUF4362 domain-containing protein n=1 Tax=Mangrovibacillus cuniculi TaxID=2593652 RepID=A0A7S8C9H3_9BACI|nr:DUF4362 domain-containing protein [Mangrovibacillus cuniculi]QPC45887.1 DUF4362 domain-containing protein [Mangrovibacillus cuniculi]
MKKYMFLCLLLLVGCSTTQENWETAIPELTTLGTDIVDEQGNIKNGSFLEEFEEKVKQGIKSTVRIITYTEEGAPIVTTLDFDGENITTTKDERRDSNGLREFSTVQCKKIDVNEVERSLDYRLSGCEGDKWVL